MAAATVFLLAAILGALLLHSSIAINPEPLVENIMMPSKDFNKHMRIKPKIFHGREKRRISTTREDDGLHAHDLSINYNLDGNDYILDLRLNRELISENHFVRYQKNGQNVIQNSTKEDFDLCQYVGHIRHIENSWVAVSTCRGLRGVIYDGENMHYIQAGEDNSLDGEHFLYKHEDLISNHTCGYVGGHHHHSTSFDTNTSKARHKREASQPQIRGPYNSNKRSRYVELVLVVDNKEYKHLGESIRDVNHHCNDIANIINSLYAPLNIFIALVGVVIWTERDEIPLSDNGDTTLTNFLQYRRKVLVKDYPNDNAQLLTREQFAGGVVGKALKGPICTYEFSGGVAMDHSDVVGLVATTIAHEMGHNFGMEHDTESCICPDDRCIMSPSSSSQSPVHWSSCSLEYLALAFEHGMDYCLRNKPKQLYNSPVCGNGFVELGEECDCGLSKSCDGNTCCNPATCMLYPNATCATGECCDLKTCRPASAGTLCRSAEHECDLPEYCTGQSEFCPDDIFKMDTETCEGGKAFCFQGSCRTRNDQCRLLWGPSGESSDDKCYEMNKKGNRYGNCGYNRLKKDFSKCLDEHSLCGMLHCRHLNERLEFGMESVAILSHSFINNNGSILPCRSAIVDLGLNQVDPGLVPDGAKCGIGKMCVNQKCLSVESLRLEVQSKAGTNTICPSNCSGHGVCNSLGHCHCDEGYAPPLCDYPGLGGSLDSGPASPNSSKDLITFIFVAIAAIVSAISLLAFLSYYSQHNAVTCLKKPKALSLKSSAKNGLQRRLSRGTSFRGLCSPSNSIPATISPTTGNLSPDDMNSSLLPNQNSATGERILTENFFGHFKGFSLAPIQKQERSFGVTNQNFGIENEQNKSVSSFSPKSPDRNNVKNLVNEINAKNTSEKSNVTGNGSVTSDQTKKIPQRSAPPIPSVPSVTVKIPTNKTNTIGRTASINKSFVSSSQTDKSKSIAAGFENLSKVSVVPAMPSVNLEASNSRPVISNPILETSTCTAKELVSPLKHSSGSVVTNVPLRTAPPAPSTAQRPLSSPNSVVNNVSLQDEPPNKKKDGTTLNRIASFLKQDKSDKEKSRNSVERSHSLPKNQHNQVKAFKNIDKNELRTLPISNPIPLNDIDLPTNVIPVISNSDETDDSKMMVMRAQSMRGPASPQKPKIPTFGSMRQPSGMKRPTSIPVGNRPSSPPPPRPNLPINRISLENNISKDVNNRLNNKTPEYDDCVAETHNNLSNISEESPSDNIYAIIEESPPPNTYNKTFNKPLPSIPSKNVEPPKTSVEEKPKNSDTLGLLGEIVSEIQNRNQESIYSTSTLSRKKREKEGLSNLSDVDNEFDEASSNYGSVSQYKTGENEYTNVNQVKPLSSAASTTSSGYLSPSAVNVPVHGQSKINMSTDFNKDSSSVTTNGTDKPIGKIENSNNPFLSNLNRAVTNSFNKSTALNSATNSNKVEDNKTSRYENQNKINADITNNDKKNVPLTGIRKLTPPKSSGQTNLKSVNNTQNIPTNSRISGNIPKPSFKPSTPVETNSPDIVSSCATTQSVKSPDVVNSNDNQLKTNNTFKPTGVNQGVILKPSLQTSTFSKPSVTTFQRPPNSTVSKPLIKKESPKTTATVNGSDLSKSASRSAPAPPSSNNAKKIVPPRPNLPKVLQNNVTSQKNNITSSNTPSLSKSNSFDSNSSNNSKVESVNEKQKQSNIKAIGKKSDDVTNNKTASVSVKPTPNLRTSNVANLQQKFEKNNSKLTASAKKS